MKAQQNIFLIDASQGYQGIHVFDSRLPQDGGVGAVSMQDHSLGQQFTEFHTPAVINLKNAHLHAGIQKGSGQIVGCPAAADNHHLPGRFRVKSHPSQKSLGIQRWADKTQFITLLKPEGTGGNIDFPISFHAADQHIAPEFLTEF